MTAPTIQSSGRYVLDRPLGRGGMAEVFAGRLISAAGVTRQVAIKRIRPDRCDTAERLALFREMFIAEAQLSARLRHDNIVAILGFEEDIAGELFLVMELVEGIDLNALLRTGPLQPPVALFVATEILQGLAHAHDLPVEDDGVRGLVHRDVSPQNILLSWDGAVKVSDFGIAKARHATEATGSLHSKGKFAYLSPEYAQGHSLDGRSDLFAVGVVLWEMLAGEPLFNRASDAATLTSLMYGSYPSPCSRRPAISADIEQATMRLLAKSRDDRYGNARAAIAALKDCAVYPKHGRELLSSLLRERFADRVPHRDGGQPTPMAPAPGEHAVDIEPLPTPGVSPKMEPLGVREVSYRMAERRFARLLALQPPMRLAMGAIVVVAVVAVGAVIATSLVMRDSRSEVVDSSPPGALPPPPPGSGAGASVIPVPSVSPPREAPAAIQARRAAAPAPGSAAEDPRPAARNRSAEPAARRPLDERAPATPAPEAPEAAKIIRIDLNGSRKR